MGEIDKNFFRMNEMIVFYERNHDSTENGGKYPQSHNVHSRGHNITLILHLLITWLEAGSDDVEGGSQDKI